VFATIRRRSRKARMRNELGQSVDHFKRAASIAATETSATVVPKINAARERVQPAASAARDAASQGWDSALAALNAASENVRQAGKTTRKATRRELKAERKQGRKLQRRAEKAIGRNRKSRAGRLVGWALFGTALGVGAAYVARRRREAQWDEYEPASSRTGADSAAFEPIEPTVYTSSANGTNTEQSKSKQEPR
jgi:hypothetical protein